MFSRTILNDIRDRISISSFIGERVQLKRAGRNMKGSCPFHNEKTPSFNVSDEKGIFHCFGCGEGGDIFKFVMKFDGLSFNEAVKYLADRAGIALPVTKDPALMAAEDEATRKKRYYLRINEIARDYFVGRLTDAKAGAKAREYLQLRGIKEEFSTQLFLGSADNNWDGLLNHLQGKNAPIEMAAELGLLKKRDGGGYYDFFRNRLIFPIVSPRGEVLGFSGRDLGGEKDAAKYLNSPDSPVYHKSSCVYGLNEAGRAIRDEDRVIFVEGNIDVATLEQEGVKNVVAPLGTALTAGHVKLLSRYTRNFVVAFDGDEAGKKAAIRALEIFIGEGISPRVLELPSGEDPDSFVRKNGAAEFKKRAEKARSLFEYFVDVTIAENGADAAGRIASLPMILPLLKLVSDPAQRSIYKRYAARRLDIDENALEKSVASQKIFAVKAPPQKDAGSKRSSVPDGFGTNHAEKTIVDLVLCHPEKAGGILGKLDPALFEDEWCRAVVKLLKEEFDREGNLRIDNFADEIEDQELSAQVRQISLGAEKYSESDIGDMIGDCLTYMAKKPVMAKIEKINEDIKQAEMEGQNEKLFTLLKEKKELAETLRGGAK